MHENVVNHVYMYIIYYTVNAWWGFFCKFLGVFSVNCTGNNENVVDRV